MGKMAQKTGSDHDANAILRRGLKSRCQNLKTKATFALLHARGTNVLLLGSILLPGDCFTTVSPPHWLGLSTSRPEMSVIFFLLLGPI